MGSGRCLAAKWAASLETTMPGPLPYKHHPRWAGERLGRPRAAVGRRRLVGPTWPSGGLKLLLGVAAPVWPRTWRVGGMQWPRVLREGDVMGWPQWKRGHGGGFHTCSCSAASHCTGDLGLGLCVTWGQQGPAAGQGEAATKDLAPRWCPPDSMASGGPSVSWICKQPPRAAMYFLHCLGGFALAPIPVPG